MVKVDGQASKANTIRKKEVSDVEHSAHQGPTDDKGERLGWLSGRLKGSMGGLPASGR